MHFTAYNTESAGATAMKYEEVEKNATKELGVLQTDKAEKITGSAFSEQAGELLVEQTFNYNPEEETLTNWDVVEKITISANTDKTFEVPILAPRARVRFKNGGVNTKKVRIFARCTFQQGK